MSSFKTLRATLPAFILSVLAACGGGDGGGTTNPPPTPAGFTVSLSSTTLSVEQGASGSITATIGRTGSFSGTVNLSTESVPTGITATFNPAAITSGTTSTTLSVAVAATVTPGNYTFTIRGQATGLTDQTATVSMTVTPKPAIAMALSATAATVVQGSGTSYTATITRTNFTGAVNVAVTGAPTGVTATVSNVADVYTVNVAVGAAVAAGAYTLTTTASGTGVTNVTATYTLTVDLLRTITLSANPAALTVSQGNSGATTITIQRLNTTTSVAVAISGQPSGVGANSSQPGTGNTSTITFTVGGAVAPGAYPITVTGSGTGVANATTTVTLTVAANQTASIALSLSRPVSLPQGGTDQTSLVITRTNYTAQVNLAIGTLPSGITASLGQTSTLGNGTTLTVGAAGNVAPGSYQFTITASGAGVTNATLNVGVTVTAASAGNVTFSFCGTNADLPVWVGYQDGGNGWAQAAGSNNTYSFNIASTGGVAWVTQSGTTNYELFVYYGTASELNAYGAGFCTTPLTKTVTGTVAGLGASDQASIQFGGRSPSSGGTFASPAFSISGVPDGPRDLVGSRSAFDIQNPLAGFQINKVFIKRGLNPANGGSVGTVDFGSATDAFDPDSKTVTINGSAGGEALAAFAAFTTADHSSITLGLPTSTSSSNVVTYKAIPSSRTVAGDLHMLSATAMTLAGTDLVAQRFVGTFFRDATNTTITLGAAHSVPTVTIDALSGAGVRLRSSWSRQSDYESIWQARYVQATGSFSRAVFVLATPGYVGAASTIDLRLPNLAAVPGFQQSWGLQQGTEVTWTTTSTGYVLGGGNAAEGSQFRSALRYGKLTP